MLLLLLSLIAQPTTGAEEPIDPKIRSAARKLGAEGITLFDQGKYEEALDRFDRAEKLVPAPTLGIRAARCLVKLGRLVEASERYLQVTRAELEPSSTWQLRRAKQEAQQERDLLLPRIPNLEIVLRGPKGKGVEVLLDRTVVPAQLIGTAYPVDPGTHDVEARRQDITIKQTTQVKERETVQVVLLLPELPKAEEAPKQPDFDYTLWGWVGIGIGGGGVLAAVINGSAALAQQSDLEERCPDRSCPPEAHAAADAFDATRVATTIGMILGVVGLGAGTTLLILAPRASGGDDQQPDADGEDNGEDDDSSDESGAAALWLGLGSVGLTYRF